jgi:hypothetical protein
MAKKKARKRAPAKKKRVQKIKLQVPLAETAMPRVLSQWSGSGAYLMVALGSRVTMPARDAFMKSLPAGLSGKVVEGPDGVLFEFRVDAKKKKYPSVDALLGLADDLNRRFLKRGLRSTVVLEVLQGGMYTRIEADLLNPIVD